MEPSGQQPPRKVLKTRPARQRHRRAVSTSSPRNGLCDGHHYTLVENAPAKHKFAAIDFEPGDDIIMYGVLVGKASQKISRGQLLSTNNLRHDASPYQRRNQSVEWTAPDVSRWKARTFFGYRRADGKLGPAITGSCFHLFFAKTGISRPQARA